MPIWLIDGPQQEHRRLQNIIGSSYAEQPGRVLIVGCIASLHLPHRIAAAPLTSHYTTCRFFIVGCVQSRGAILLQHPTGGDFNVVRPTDRPQPLLLTLASGATGRPARQQWQRGLPPSCYYSIAAAAAHNCCRPPIRPSAPIFLASSE